MYPLSIKNLSQARGYYVPYLSTTGICISSINISKVFPGILGPYIFPLLLSILSSRVFYTSLLDVLDEKFILSLT